MSTNSVSLLINAMPFLIAIIVPAVGLISTVIAVGLWLRHSSRRRALLSQERLALIQQGKELPPGLLLDSSPVTRLGYLLRSLIWLAIGAGISLFFIVMAIVEGDKELWAVATISIIPLGVSMAYRVVYKKMPEDGASGSAGPESPNQ